MHIVEIVVIVLVLFVIIFQFISIPTVNTEWSETKLHMMGNDLLFALDTMYVDWLDTESIDDLLSDAITQGGTRNTTVVYDLSLKGVLKPVIRVGCICKDDPSPVLNELNPVRNALETFYLNGANVSFDVVYIDPASPTFSHENDVTIIMPDFFEGTFHAPYVLNDFETQIRNYLGDDRGILVVRNYTAADVAVGTVDQSYFGLGWNGLLVPSGLMSMTGEVSYPNSSYYDVYKYFYNLPNYTGIKTEYPHFFTNLLHVQERPVPSEITSAQCVLEDVGGLCGLIANRGAVKGRGRSAWLSRSEGSGPLATDAETAVLLKSVVSWLAGDTHSIISNQNMNEPVISNQFIMMEPAWLVGLWDFEEGAGTMAYDSSSRANHGLVNDAQWASGRVRSGLRFDGNGDYVNITDASDFQDLGAFTIEAWAYFSEDSTVSESHTISQLSSSDTVQPNHNVFWFGRQSGNMLALSVSDASGNPSQVVSSVPLNNNEWYHVAGSWDGDTLSVFINGEPDNSMPWDYQLDETGGYLHIGADEDYVAGSVVMDDFMNGTIDNAIFFSQALGTEKIRSHYSFPDQFMFQPIEVKLTLGYIY